MGIPGYRWNTAYWVRILSSYSGPLNHPEKSRRLAADRAATGSEEPEKVPGWRRGRGSAVPRFRCSLQFSPWDYPEALLVFQEIIWHVVTVLQVNWMENWCSLKGNYILKNAHNYPVSQVIDIPCEVAVLSSRTPFKCNHTTAVVQQPYLRVCKQKCEERQPSYLDQFLSREKLFAIG